jgi:hypothetical protein
MGHEPEASLKSRHFKLFMLFFTQNTIRRPRSNRGNLFSIINPSFSSITNFFFLQRPDGSDTKHLFLHLWKAVVVTKLVFEVFSLPALRRKIKIKNPNHVIDPTRYAHGS